MPDLLDTINLAKVRHGAQMYGNQPYMYHLLGVLTKFINHPIYFTLPEDLRNDIVFAIVLHDTLEDTATTEQELLDMGYSERCVRFVKLVTRKPEDNMTYMEKIDYIVASEEIGAMLVKFFDNEFNHEGCDGPFANDEERIKYDGMRGRYQRSMNNLRKGLANHSIQI